MYTQLTYFKLILRFSVTLEARPTVVKENGS